MRPRTVLLAGPAVALLTVAAFSCSAVATRNGFGGAGSEGVGGSSTGAGNGSGQGGGVVIMGQDSGPLAQCTGLQCQAATDDCAGKGKPLTTISGTVYDPAGALPLYNVYVYIPNTKPDAILTGNPKCTQCEAPASGNPVIGALTDASGKFTLSYASGDTWGVPSGTDVPIVLQVGKWRRQLTIPTVTACTANALPDPSTPADKLRLPAKSSEGDMPLIAFTSGCDPAECFLRQVGIDDSEFVPPGSTAGHVVFYTGQDADNFNGTDASMVAGGNSSADTYQWWTSSANLLKYDIIFNACECNPNDRGANAYPAMDAYLNGGGRLFATHYYYNWFAPPTGTPDLQDVVTWNNMNNDSNPPYNNYYIDQSFPKGAAYAQWLQNVGATTTLGLINLQDTRWDMDDTTSESSRWIFNANNTSGSYATMYMSFNTPTAATAANQCGRAVFSDVHLSGTSDDSIFPNECANADPDGSHAVNQQALEFLFFDLSSCVQENNVYPPPPPPT